jgi:hypothetical protein
MDVCVCVCVFYSGTIGLHIAGNKPLPWTNVRHLEADDRRLEFSTVPFDPRILFTLSQHNKYARHLVCDAVCDAVADCSFWFVAARLR